MIGVVAGGGGVPGAPFIEDQADFSIRIDLVQRLALLDDQVLYRRGAVESARLIVDKPSWRDFRT